MEKPAVVASSKEEHFLLIKLMQIIMSKSHESSYFTISCPFEKLSFENFYGASLNGTPSHLTAALA